MKIVEIVREAFDYKTTRRDLTSAQVRKISAKLFKTIDDKSINHILILSETLLKEREWALFLIAYDWAFRVKGQYTRDTFEIFERWLKTYTMDWLDCDDFCVHAFGELLYQYNDLFDKVVKWTSHDSFVVRRASAVVLIYSINKGHYQDFDIFKISDMLLYDEHYLVQKGYGWMLKKYALFEPERVYNYLLSHKADMPRLSFRYALNKLDTPYKEKLMGK
jgi:3-methyladenine DNA glycosylase AlkD